MVWKKKKNSSSNKYDFCGGKTYAWHRNRPNTPTLKTQTTSPMRLYFALKRI
jgi:hypothetical protein